MILNKINEIIFKKKNNIELTKECQNEILNRVKIKYFKESYLDRSFCQYKVQNYEMKKIKKTILNLLVLITFPMLIFILIIKKLLIVKKNKIEAIFGSYTNETIPNEFISIKKYCFKNNYCLKFIDLKYINKILKYKEGLFILKSILLIANYRYNIELYSPKKILVNKEFSFCSSLLTEFCEINNIQHINYMHGEKIYDINDSFFKFHHCYVWLEHYKNLFISMEAEKMQFIIENSKNMEFKKNINEEKNLLIYYLQDETSKELEQLKIILEEVSEKKLLKYEVRIHPRVSEEKIVRKIFDEKNIEKNFSINDSLSRAEFIVSKYSTVLFQGYKNNKKIVINDITREDFFLKLKNLEYFIFKIEHIKLSDMLIN